MCFTAKLAMSEVGHLRRLSDVGGMSAIASTATELLHNGMRRKGRVARRNLTPGRSQIRA